MAKNTGKWAAGALLAGLAGYVAGVLTAPKSGKETRQDIKKAASKAKTEAERRLKQLHSKLDVLIEQAKKNASKLQAQAKVDLDKLLVNAQAAKEKARVLLSALHEGDEANDKDLKQAIDDVNAAIDHLKTFMKKNVTESQK